MFESRTELLLGGEKLSKLKRANILIVGVGGVGGYAAEMLARASVGSMTLVDADIVNTTNINRQIIALHSTVDQPKVKVLAERLQDINPNIKLNLIEKFVQTEDIEAILSKEKYDYVVDAIDTLTPKIELIRLSLEKSIPLVSSMGAGSKLDPTKIEIVDISKTHHCPLAHMLRKRLHKIGIRKGFKAVFSAEPPIEGSMILCNEQNKKSNVGTISYLPPSFGIAAASAVIRDIVAEQNI
ncbi:MAG: tRNA threonylcarbamoyladenosine dehydratase [Rikenellaceae bacterium]